MVLTGTFSCPTRVTNGHPWQQAVVAIAGRRPWTLVTSGGWQERLAVDATGAPDEPTAVIATVEPNPKESSLPELARRMAETGAGVVVALGGGSVLDAVKGALALGLLDHDRSRLRTHLGEGTSLPAGARPDFVAVPTTAGTGSEVTQWGTIWGDDGQKYSVSDPAVQPDWAVHDASLLLSQPREVILAGGLDALSHAMEAIWNTNRTDVSDALAANAIRLVRRHLPDALADAADVNAQRGMQTAALIAGYAMGCTKTALAHSISYPFTAVYGLEHGIACSFTLGALARFNGSAAPEAISKIAAAFGVPDTALPDEIDSWMRELGVGQVLADRLPDDPVKRLEGKLITPARAANNARPATDADAVTLARDSIHALTMVEA